MKHSPRHEKASSVIFADGFPWFGIFLLYLYSPYSSTFPWKCLKDDTKFPLFSEKVSILDEHYVTFPEIALSRVPL